jgi:hypothetical protein
VVRVNTLLSLPSRLLFPVRTTDNREGRASRRSSLRKTAGEETAGAETAGEETAG